MIGNCWDYLIYVGNPYRLVFQRCLYHWVVGINLWECILLFILLILLSSRLSFYSNVIDMRIAIYCSKSLSKNVGYFPDQTYILHYPICQFRFYMYNHASYQVFQFISLYNHASFCITDTSCRSLQLLVWFEPSWPF